MKNVWFFSAHVCLDLGFFRFLYSWREKLAACTTFCSKHSLGSTLNFVKRRNVLKNVHINDILFLLNDVNLKLQFCETEIQLTHLQFNFTFQDP